MIHRNIEESLYLLRVQVHGQDSVCAGGDEKICNQLGRNGHPRLVFAILPGIAIKRQHRGDARCAGPPQRINHDEHLHQMMVRWRAGGLNQEDVFAADVLLDFDERFAVGERLDSGFPQLDSDIAADGLS